MNVRLRTIEVEEATAERLESLAAARGISLADLLAELAFEDAWPPDLEAKNLDVLRAAGEGPWSPEALAEDERRWAEYQRTGEGVPWEEIRAWMQSWGTPEELPPPRPRKL